MRHQEQKMKQAPNIWLTYSRGECMIELPTREILGAMKRRSLGLPLLVFVQAVRTGYWNTT